MDRKSPRLMSIPTLMFLYNNDATEIRYSDGSKLELSPCGSTMVSHRGDQRILTKEKILQKRTRFVTSEHRTKVLQAMDFRNRFAERPYLCTELIHKEDIISLYANIKEIAWPKVVDQADVDILEDGSRKITSLDEYASLVVSPHCQDFTVCYLSKTSKENKKSPKDLTCNSKSLNSRLSSQLTEASVNSSCILPKEAIVHPYKNTEDDNVDYVVGNCNNSSTHLKNRHRTNKTNENKSQNDSGSVRDKSVFSENQHAFKPDYVRMVTEDSQFNLRHIPVLRERHDSQRSDSQVTVGSPTTHEISSISRSSTPDGLRTVIDTTDISISNDVSSDHSLVKTPVHKHRHSSPTRCTSSPTPAVEENFPPLFKKTYHGENNPLDGVFLGNEQDDIKTLVQTQHACLNESYNSLDNDETLKGSFEKDESNLEELPTLLNEIRFVEGAQDINNYHIKDKPDVFNHSSCTENLQVVSETVQTKIHKDSYLGQTPSSHSKGQLPTSSSHSSSAAEHSSEESDQRALYVWRTLHISRNSCPTEWSHPLNIALRGKVLKGEDIAIHPSLQKLQSTASVSKIDKNKCCLTPAPVPAPLVCPFQHEHRRDQFLKSRNDECRTEGSSVGEFDHGRLKIIISEGIVYRLVYGGSLTVIEVHPGDGSIMVSQGMSAHFFTHFVLVGDRLEERTHSLKSLPPEQSKQKYSVGKLIKTAHRFFIMATQWEKRGLKEEMPCWKKEIVAVVEPLSSSLLEECKVEGLGKFTAFSSGRVRIMFDDRVALDLQCCFDKIMKQTGQIQPSQTAIVQAWSHPTGRLMLPSGEYVTVDLDNPGVYRRYIEAAKEWVSWVNSTPLERQEFYQQANMPDVIKRSAEHELKKIVCFNYILEQTQSYESSSNIIHSTIKSTNLPLKNTSKDPPPPRGILCSSSVERSQAVNDRGQVRQPPLGGNSENVRYKQMFGKDSSNLTPRQEHLIGSDSSFSSGDHPRGHQSVRQTLLQTSNMVNDIDDFLASIKKA